MASIKGFIDYWVKATDPEDEYEDDEMMEQPEPSPSTGTTNLQAESKPLSDYSSSRRTNGGKVVNINATTQLAVVLVKPERFESAATIADHLKDRRTVVLNLEETQKEDARRLVDFLSGVAYANEGKIQRIAHNTYIITPYNVDLMGDLLDELESSGVYL